MSRQESAPICRLCGRSDPRVAAFLGVCADCLRGRPAEALPLAEEAHVRARREFGLPPQPPRSPGGARCGLCVHDCRMGEGEVGYCGLREGRRGRLHHRGGTAQHGVLHWYDDPIPTNCVAEWVCPAGRAHGKVNLAVFYGACSLDCLGCQNWQYRDLSPDVDELSAAELAAAAGAHTECICYFGGDPTPQMPHALATSRLLAGRGVRVCWETNGTMSPRLLDQAVDLSLATGGVVKFDLKAWSEPLHIALTGFSNRRTLANLARAARRFHEQPDPPLLVAATLLVPGYVDAQEVGALARHIASLSPDIPYALLGFGPAFFLSDLPPTSRRHAAECLAAAQEAGLRNVRVGNRHLLGSAY